MPIWELALQSKSELHLQRVQRLLRKILIWNAAAEKTTSLQALIDKLLKETKDIEKIRVQVTEIQRKLADFVLKEDYLKTVNDLRNLKEDVAINKEDLAALTAEVEKLKDILARMQFPSMEDFNLLRGRVDSLEN